MRWFEERIDQSLTNPGQNNATRYGVSIIPAAVQPGQAYWRAIGVYHLSGKENAGKNNIFLDVLDEEGRRIGPPWPLVDWAWQGMRPHERPGVVVLDKPTSEPGGNIGLHAGQVVTVWVAGRPSDKVTGLQTAGIDDPNEEPGNHRYHHSFYVVFRKTVKGEEGEPPKEESPGTEEPAPVDWRAKLGVGQLWLLEQHLRLRNSPEGELIARMARLLDGK